MSEVTRTVKTIPIAAVTSPAGMRASIAASKAKTPEEAEKVAREAYAVAKAEEQAAPAGGDLRRRYALAVIRIASGKPPEGDQDMVDAFLACDVPVVGPAEWAERVAAWQRMLKT